MTKQALPRLNIRLTTPLLAAALLAVTAASSFAQSDAPKTPAPPSAEDSPYTPTMTFEVASVRQANVNWHEGFMMSGGWVPQTATLRVLNWSIEDLIVAAYGVDRSQIAGAPNWPYPTMFVINAKGNSETNTKIAALPKKQQFAEQQHMLQALLEDRFKLKTHWTTKEGDIYNLVVAKGGPKLSAEGSTPPSAEELKYLGDHPVPTLYQKNDGQAMDFIAHGCRMDQWVGMLTAMFGRPVIDRTGLTAKYDFVIKYKSSLDRYRDPDDLDPTPTLDRALPEQLGLKVEPAKGPIKLLVIDHIEKPSEN